MLSQMEARRQPVVCVAERVWGAPYLFQELTKQQETCLWCDLGEEEAGDPIATGNKLADALSRALGCQVVGNGMAYDYVVSVLTQHVGLFAPLTLILSGAEHAQGLAHDLVQLQASGVKVVLEFTRLPERFLIPEDAIVFRADDLRLTEEEARVILAEHSERLSDVEMSNLYRLSGGAYETLLLELHRHLNLPPKLRPHPEGAALPPGAAMAVPPEVFLKVLERRGRWLEALEVAAEHAPGRVPELLSEAGDVYFARGRYAKLFNLLEALPEEVKADETTLFWRLRSAQRLNLEADLRESVERHLATHDAPDLRALYASQLPGERGFAEVERAYRSAKTFTTLQHYGNAWTFRNPERGLEVFRDLTLLGETVSHPLKRAAATMLMAFPLGLLGRYHEAASWLEEALTLFDAAKGGDWQLRLHTLSNLAYTRILIGETVGLREVLEREVKALQAASPERATGFRSTLGDYLLSQGDAETASAYYLENLDLFEQLAAQSWYLSPYLLYNAVQGLLHADQLERAGALARKYYLLLQEVPGQVRTYARLSHGMVLALTEPEAAIEPLEEACDDLEVALKGDHLVSACSYLAKAYLSLERQGDARAALARCEVGIRELSETGFRLLAGPPEHFGEVKALWRGHEAPLKLSFLGQHEVCLYNKRLKLPPQLLDILALLARYPEGLSPEGLLLRLYGEGGKLSTLKGALSKLRRAVPITRAPYRLDTEFEADFLTLEALLRKGHLRAGLELYRGPLLPKSDTPGVTEIRETLEELLRQVALASKDPDALLNLSKRLEEDLELWEASLEALPEHDPRRAVAKAEFQRVLGTW